MIYYVSFLLWFVVVTFITLVFWLKPNSFSNWWQNSYVAPMQDAVVSIFAVLFFITCFVLGIIISVVRMKGII